MPAPPTEPLLRGRHGHTRVTNEELFFDLLYAFSVTQLSHRLVEHLSPIGALETAVLWFAVWLGWQYTMWATNWFNPQNPRVRTLLFATMLVGLVVASAIPDAFGARGGVFAAGYAAIQVGRSALLVVWLRRGGHRELLPNYRRILGWVCISGVFWIAGAAVDEPTGRLGCWVVAAACEYLSPTIGFALPGLGRSRSSRDWTVEGGHIAERCQLFVMVALGESVIATGAGFGGAAHPGVPAVLGLVVTFVGSVAMWWIYFDTAAGQGTRAITGAADPGRIAAWFGYVHGTLIAAIIVSAVADELVLHHPDAPTDVAAAAALIGGPLLFVLANAAFKRIVYGRLPLSHLVGAAALAALFPLALAADRLIVGAWTTGVLVGVGAWHARRRPQVAPR